MSTPTLAVTGHSNLARYPQAKATIHQALRGLVTTYPGALWLAGAQVGTDQIAVDLLLALDQNVALVLPCPAATMTLCFTADEYYTFAKHSRLVLGVEVVCQKLEADSSFRRNQWVLERSDLLVAFLDPDERHGRTQGMVHHALSRRVPVYWARL